MWVRNQLIKKTIFKVLLKAGILLPKKEPSYSIAIKRLIIRLELTLIDFFKIK
jgi:hypothetical protein